MTYLPENGSPTPHSSHTHDPSTKECAMCDNATEYCSRNEEWKIQNCVASIFIRIFSMASIASTSTRNPLRASKRNNTWCQRIYLYFSPHFFSFRSHENRLKSHLHFVATPSSWRTEWMRNMRKFVALPFSVFSLFANERSNVRFHFTIWFPLFAISHSQQTTTKPTAIASRCTTRQQVLLQFHAEADAKHYKRLRVSVVQWLSEWLGYKQRMNRSCNEWHRQNWKEKNCFFLSCSLPSTVVRRTPQRIYPHTLQTTHSHTYIRWTE